MMEFKLIKKEENRIKKGYPLITKDSIINSNRLKQEGTVFKLLDSNNRFLATAYYGLQNKGIGWILSRDESEAIDEQFFKEKIAKGLKKREEFYLNIDTTAFRVFNNEGDGIGGMTIDYYNGYYLINWYSEGIYSFRKDIYQALQNAKNYQGIYEKKALTQKGSISSKMIL